MDKEKKWATRYGACGSIQAGKLMEKELMSYGVHLSHKVIQKIRQFQMVHFVLKKVIRRDNIESITMFAQSKTYFRCIEWFYHQISIPDLFTFHEEHEIHPIAAIFEIWLSCSCFHETGVLGDLV